MPIDPVTIVMASGYILVQEFSQRRDIQNLAPDAIKAEADHEMSLAESLWHDLYFISGEERTKPLISAIEHYSSAYQLYHQVPPRVKRFMLFFTIQDNTPVEKAVWARVNILERLTLIYYELGEKEVAYKYATLLAQLSSIYTYNREIREVLDEMGISYNLSIPYNSPEPPVTYF